MHQAALQADHQLKEYKILELIGEGGFGLTYLAQDTLLNKKVAIKEYFPSEFAIRNEQTNVSSKSQSSQELFNWGLESFLKEAQMLAQFDDANIVKVHRFFESNGTAYIVMEYLQCGNLTDLLAKKTKLSEKETQELLIPLVMSLQKVHDKGVLHRDIKPDNIMLRDDRTPVLIDFGASRYAMSEKTQTMTALFTPGFAPVEQYGKNSQPGPWTDIYSLAAVAYKCMTGVNPPNVMDRVNKDSILKLGQVFEDSPFYNSIDKALSIASDDRPRSLNSWVASWPHSKNVESEETSVTRLNTQPAVNVITEETKKHYKIKLLTMIPLVLLVSFLAYQYIDLPSEQSVNTDLSHQIDKSGDELQQSIAVLPFKSVSQGPDNDFFVNGVHDDLITQLAKIKSLKVISQGSMTEYLDTSKSFSEIGAELDVQNLLVGTVQRGGDRVRINVKLYKPADNELVWAESYNRELNTTNIFEIQSEIARAITINLKTTISSEELSNLAKAYTNNLQAFEYYLRAKETGREAYSDEMEGAIELFRTAIQLDPDFKEAWTELALQLLEHYWFSDGDRQILVEAKEAIEGARRVDSDFSELYLAEGLYHYYADLNYKKAIEFFDLSIAKNPGLAEAYFFKGAAMRRAGQFMDSITVLKKSLELNPRDFFDWLQLEESYTLLGDWSNSLSALQKSEALVGENSIVKYHKANSLINRQMDIKGASELILATQYVKNKIPNNLFIEIQTLNRNYDASISVAEKFTPDMEIWRQRITLKEDYLARLNFLKGNVEKTREYAFSALGRLNKMELESPDDYRLFLPMARMYALLKDKEKTLEYIEKFKDNRPMDHFERAHQEYHMARIYSMANLKELALSQLKTAIQPPTYFHRNFALLDPHFEHLKGQF